MRLGVLSDIHGNLHALDAVLADGRAQGVQRWWALGDLVALGPDPHGTLSRLAATPDLVATRGNTERYVLSGDRPPPHAADVLADPSLLERFVTIEASFSWTKGAVTAGGWLPWLVALPLEVRTVLEDGTRVLGVHASPGRDDGDGISPERPEPELRAALDGADADMVVAGHTHRPTDRSVGGIRALNPGCVSNPIIDDVRACYLILHDDGDGHEVEHRRVEYDRDAFLRAVRDSGHPAAGYIASHPPQRS
jgi:predicted phosphodiesterase